MGGDRRFKRDAGSDLDSGFCEPIELGWIVGEQDDSRAVQGLQHQRSNAVVALIVFEAERRVGITRIEPAVLQSIGSHLIRKANTSAFLRHI